MDIHIQDNFLKDPDSIREKVLTEGEFKGQEYEGHFYKGVDLSCPLDVVDDIGDILGKDINPSFAFWRLSRPHEEIPAAVHADTVCARWAGILYMTPTEEMGGTAMWAHKELGDWQVPPRFMRGASGSKEYFERVNSDSNDEEKWDMRLLIRAKYNRFACYPTRYFHSRYPFNSENYGTTKDEARLIWVIFFN